MSAQPPFELPDDSAAHDHDAEPLLAPDLSESLRLELEGEEGSFLLKLRVDLCWEPDHATALLTRMYSYIHSTVGSKLLNRKVAGDMWLVIHFIRNWSSHEAFRHANPYPDEYYNEVYELLFILGDWYFTGECPFTHPESVMEEIRSLQQFNIG
ncbi:hypothetical protein [Paenibacillus campi]|uniref:hypothetical protein n=1 Tax=Paenibacillus campi TaxID=3106031 RepID=UPI002AFF503A|nr:hypothetical protein [Paenibacillus sp. SGZ-1014]